MTAPAPPRPATVAEFLSEAYALTHRLRPGEVSALVGEMAATSLPTAQLAAERDRLKAVEARCVVSGTHRGFLDAVIAARG